MWKELINVFRSYLRFRYSLVLLLIMINQPVAQDVNFTFDKHISELHSVHLADMLYLKPSVCC